jgi:hypothetical protein
MERSKKPLLAAIVAVCLFSLGAPSVQAYEEGEDASIMLDLVVLRPAGLVATVAGTVFFVASLPIAIGTWSLGRSFNSFVKRPIVYTFVRDLGEPRP